jgi:hypothetical protein
LEDRRLLSSLVVGDFNGDQRLDMAVINDNGLTVLLNQGNGAFLAVPVLGLTDVGEGPASLVAGDFNGDGTLDLAVATPAADRPGGGCITVLLGLGNGNFQQAFHLDIHGIPSALVAGDFNGDGTLDLAVATFAGDRPGGGCITVLSGEGNGSFVQTFDIPVNGSPTSLVVGDFNGDGILDLAVATVEDRPGGGCITVLLGQGDGSFQQAFDIHVHGHPSALVAGDFNGDGKLDLAVANNESVTILFGNGDGSFVSGPNLSLSETGDDSSSESGGDIQEGLATADVLWSSPSLQSVLQL